MLWVDAGNHDFFDGTFFRNWHRQGVQLVQILTGLILFEFNDISIIMKWLDKDTNMNMNLDINLNLDLMMWCLILYLKF